MCQLSRSVLLFLLWGMIASNLQGTKLHSQPYWDEASTLELNRLVQEKIEATGELPKNFRSGWGDIAKSMKRTIKGVRERYLNVQDPGRNVTPLNKKEIINLLGLVYNNGEGVIPWKDWVSKFSGRKEIFLKNTYNAVKRKWKRYYEKTQYYDSNLRVWIPHLLEFIKEYGFQAGVCFYDQKNKVTSTKRRRVGDSEKSEAASAGYGAGGAESEAESEIDLESDLGVFFAGCGADGAADFEIDYKKCVSSGLGVDPEAADTSVFPFQAK